MQACFEPDGCTGIVFAANAKSREGTLSASLQKIHITVSITPRSTVLTGVLQSLAMDFIPDVLPRVLCASFINMKHVTLDRQG